MSQSQRRWIVKKQDPDLCKNFSQSLNISPLTSQILINKGIVTLDQADFFLNACLKDLYSPFLMKDMEKSVQRIIQAVTNGEKICIYGDYDVDGITATAIMVLFLKEIGSSVFFYIPDRIGEGYGLNSRAIHTIKNKGAKLIITVDCGISDAEPIDFAQSLGMDVIVTDHHEPPEKLPSAYAIINPKQSDCNFPFKDLAGVGVAFNLLMAIRKKLRETGFWTNNQVPNLKDYLDIVAIGTIADIVPLVDENRILVKSGLEVLSYSSRPGICALKAVSETDASPVTCRMVAFRLAPRINATGRIGNAADGVHLLIAQDTTQAMRMAKKMNSENLRRQQIEKTILLQAREMIRGEEAGQKPFILSSQEWHPGVIGICASRLADNYYRPTILIAMDKEAGVGKGSARSVYGFDMYSALKQCKSLLKTFGGHKFAAGLTIASDNIPPFREMFAHLVREQMSQEDFIPRIEIDAQIHLGDISFGIMDEIEQLGPFGPENPEPVFSSFDIKYYSSMVVGNGHLKMKIKEDGCFYDAIGFNMGTQYCMNNEEIRLAFVPQINIWQGVKAIQLKLIDIKTIS